MNKLQRMKMKTAQAMRELQFGERLRDLKQRFSRSGGGGSRRRRGRVGAAAMLFVVLTLLAYDMGSGGEILPQRSPLPTAAQQQEQLPQPGQQGQQDQPQLQQAAADAYFAEYRLLREQSRAEELELLDEVMEDDAAGEAARNEAAGRKTELAARIEAENQAEAMLAAREYGASLVMIGDEQVTVVMAGQLDDNAALVAAQLIGETTGCSWQDVVIIPRD